LANTGDATLPTKLQAFFFRITLTEVRLDPKDDLYLVIANLHSLHQRANDLALLAPLDVIETAVDFLPERIEAPDDQVQVMLEGRLISELLTLDLDMGNALAQAGNAGLELRFLNQTLGIAVDQSGQTLAQLVQLRLQGAALLSLSRPCRLKAPSVFLRQAIGMRQQGTDFLPDREVQAVGAHLGIVTDALAPEAISIGA
jgi:hypothetical protein